MLTTDYWHGDIVNPVPSWRFVITSERQSLPSCTSAASRIFCLRPVLLTTPSIAIKAASTIAPRSFSFLTMLWPAPLLYREFESELYEVMYR